MPRHPASAAATAAFLLLGACGPAAPPPPSPLPPAAPVVIGSLVQPGIPRELAEHRAATIRNVDYDLALDLTTPGWVHGTVTIYFERAPGASHLVLDFRGLSVTELFANQVRVTDATWINEHIVVHEQHLVEGPNSVDVRFIAAAAPAGASVIRFDEPASEAGGAPGDSYFYSLLVPADASQLFPCFDQPDIKATLRLEVVAPPESQVLANGAAVDSANLNAGRWLRFEPTPPMSTYLAAFAAGPWTIWAGKAGRVPMSLYARRSRASEVDADTLLATNRRALQWLEQYFRYEYPFGKLDLLLAPAFPFGGMEHPGAIFYNESRFIFLEEPTLPERLARDATIYHEVAHQWFGDLVTMRWFDDLWLKEGFSTYMAARMQDELNPGTGAWKTFYMQNKPMAYRVEATRGTTPVWQSLGNLNQAKSNYGPIVYNKAPAIIKQLNFLVGEENFRSALQRLLRRHAFGNITWRDLLAAMEEVSGSSLAAFGEQYILRGGAPVVETQLSTRDGVIEELRLVQRPSVELGDSAAGWWPGRVRLRLGYEDREDATLTVQFSGQTTVVEEARGLPAPAYVFPNDGDYGYGIFLLDEQSAADLSGRVGRLEAPLLRTLVWGALWDLVRERRLAPEEFVEIALRELPGERDGQIADLLLARTSSALRRYIDEPGDGSVHPLRARFEQLLASGIDAPDATYDLRKGRLDELLAVARTPQSLRIVEDLLAERRLFDGEPLQQPGRWAAVRTLLALEHPGADSIFAAERARDSSPEGRRQAFIAGAARPTAASKSDYYDRYLDDTELNEEWVTASLGAFNHPLHAELTLPFLAQALDRLPWIQQNRRIFFLPQWIDGFVGGHDSVEALAIVDDHLAAHPELPEDIRRKLLQARDELARTIEIRQAAGGSGR